MGTYKRFEADDIVPGNPTQVTVGLWSGDTGSLQAFYSSSTQASSSTRGQYYWDVYQTNPSSSVLPVPEVQFSVAYGHRTGGGAPTLAQNDNATLSTTAVYSQYRNLLLEPNDTQFTFDGSYNADHIYVINIARARLKQEMDPGNWLLTLSGSSGSYTFIDDSGQTLDPTVGRAGSVYNVCSGSLTGVSGSTIANSQSVSFGGYGLFYPSLGVIVLNPAAIKQTIGMVSGSFVISGSQPFAANTGSSTVHQYNHAGIYNAIKLGANFQSRSSEIVSSTNYFVRVRNKDFNYSNNPTFFDEVNGTLIFNSFIKDPRVYVTTIGLYNDENELLAVAKLSRPTLKSFDREFIIRCRLDW
jgi:hypothetical protein